MLSNKENYKLMMDGKVPESIPQFSFGNMVGPSVLSKDQKPDRSGIDCWGVEYVFEPIAGGSIPTPGKFLIKDIRGWRDAVKVPDVSNVDWEAMAKKDLSHFDASKELVVGSYITGFFQLFINYMGFNEGLCAIVEEPDEVRELLDVTTTFYTEVIGKKIMEHYKPDMVWMPDDIATARAPFVSLNSFREVFAPSWSKFVSFYENYGVKTQLHCCGECMILVDDWVKMGIQAWDPCQTSNDWRKVKSEYGNRLALVGAMDYESLSGAPEDSEGEVREKARATLDEYAFGGGFALFGAGPEMIPEEGAEAPPPMMMPPAEPGSPMERMGWAMDEMLKAAPGYYAGGKHQ
jgi:hypothetical protein